MEKKTNISFEKAVNKLEKIVDDMENTDIDLDTVFKKFEEGIKISKYLDKKLKNYERKIEIITKDSNNGYKTEEYKDDVINNSSKNKNFDF